MARLPDHLREALQPIVDQLDDGELDALDTLIMERRQKIRAEMSRTPTQDIDMGAVPTSETRS